MVKRKLFFAIPLTILLFGCHGRDASEPEPWMGVVSDELSGINVSVDNRSERSICVPVSTLSSEAGTIELFDEKKPADIKWQTEFPEGLPREGPYLIIPSSSKGLLPVDTRSLVMKNKKYRYKITIYWMFCDSALKEDKFHIMEAKKAVLEGGLKYYGVPG